MKRVTQDMESTSIAYGSSIIKRYYDNILGEYPEWLYTEYYDLPRVQKKQEKHGNNPVVSATVGNGTEDAEKFIWIITELKGKWCSETRSTYYFELQEDAMAFKLRFS